MAKKKIEYEKALEELQLIQEELESGEVSLSEMKVKVERASYLIALCKETLRSTEEGLKKLMEETEN